MKRLRVIDKVTRSHDANTGGTSQVLAVASLQRLKLEAPAGCEVRSVINSLLKLRRDIQNKRRGMFNAGVVLLCDKWGSEVKDL